MQMKGKFTWRRIEQSSEKKLFYVSRKLPLLSLVLLLARDEKKVSIQAIRFVLTKIYHDYSVSKQVLDQYALQI